MTTHDQAAATPHQNDQFAGQRGHHEIPPGLAASGLGTLNLKSTEHLNQKSVDSGSSATSHLTEISFAPPLKLDVEPLKDLRNKELSPEERANKLVNLVRQADALDEKLSQDLREKLEKRRTINGVPLSFVNQDTFGKQMKAIMALSPNNTDLKNYVAVCREIKSLFNSTKKDITGSQKTP